MRVKQNVWDHFCREQYWQIPQASLVYSRSKYLSTFPSIWTLFEMFHLGFMKCFFLRVSSSGLFGPKHWPPQLHYVIYNDYVSTTSWNSKSINCLKGIPLVNRGVKKRKSEVNWIRRSSAPNNWTAFPETLKCSLSVCKVETVSVS